MTPELMVAGGVTEESELEFAHLPGDEGYVILKYPESEAPEAMAYSVSVEPWRLAVVVRRTEEGWVATAAVLGALGYSTESWTAAVEDLLDAVEQYLAFLRDEQPTLAPNVAHHAGYVALLDAPRGAWLASVDVDAAPVE